MMHSRESCEMAKDIPPVPSPNGEGCLLAKVNTLREPRKGVILQSATGEELDALLPSVLDKAFKGEI